MVIPLPWRAPIGQAVEQWGVVLQRWAVLPMVPAPRLCPASCRLDRADTGRAPVPRRLSLISAGRLDPDLVNSIGQALGLQVALVARSECMPILVALADNLNRALDSQSSGIGDG